MLPQPAELVQRHCLKLLAAEARHDAHHQHQTHLVQIGGHRADRRGRVQRKARHSPQTANLAKQRPGVRHGLNMDRQQIGPRPAIGFQVALGVGNHQMNVQRQLRQSPHGLDHRNAKAQVGHKVAVHHVEMEDLRPGSLQRLDFARQMTEVGGQERGPNQGNASM